ncbi:MAG: exosortase/archaeosortase family protein [Isosphaeraceae bacterium]
MARASFRAFADRIRPASPLLRVLLIILMVFWAYWPNLQTLWIIWGHEPNYSHGYLVIPVAFLIFWYRLQDAELDWSASRGPGWSWLVLVAALVVRAVAYEQNSQWIENASIIAVVASLMFTLGGWRLLKVGWPAAFFLVFMLPLPLTLNNLLALPLQRVATLGSVFMLQLLGFLALPEGTIIYLPDAPEGSRTLEVAQACNGLSMLMTLAATVTATLFLIPLANWKRIIVLASALPIALVSNIVRIVATGLCYHFIENHEARHVAHDVSGWLMMPLALVLVFLELLILAWLAADSGSQEGDDRLVIPDVPQNGVARRQARTVGDRPVLAVIPEDRGPKGKSKSKKDTLPIDD